MKQHNILLLALSFTMLLSLNPHTFATPYWMKIWNLYTVKWTWIYISILHFIAGFNWEIYLYYSLFYALVYNASDIVLNTTGFDISGHVYITFMGYTSLLHVNRKIADLFLAVWFTCVGWTLINFHTFEEKVFGACLPILFYCNMFERYPHE